MKSTLPTEMTGDYSMRRRAKNRLLGYGSPGIFLEIFQRFNSSGRFLDFIKDYYAPTPAERFSKGTGYL